MYVCGGKIACLLACLPDGGGMGGRKIIPVGDEARDTTQIQMQRVASRATNTYFLFVYSLQLPTCLGCLCLGK